MGFTPWPYDYTPKAAEETYNTLSEHGDLTAHHFDGGIPWDEALKGKPYHRSVRSEIEFRKLHTPEGHRVYIALTPLSAGRDGLAEYWAASNNMQLPEKWQNKRFNDPGVIEAYLNHCRRMIEHFDPDYAAYGIEVNMLAENPPDRFEKYLEMTGAVYRALKQEYPDLPLFLTLQLESFIKDPRTGRNAVERLLPFTDYIAVSSYPFLNDRDPNHCRTTGFYSLPI